MNSPSAEAPTAGPEDGRRFSAEDLVSYSCAVLERLDLPQDDARHVAECLVKAELRGVDSHGMIRLPVYTKRIQAKVHPAFESEEAREKGLGTQP